MSLVCYWWYAGQAGCTSGADWSIAFGRPGRLPPTLPQPALLILTFLSTHPPIACLQRAVGVLVHQPALLPHFSPSLPCPLTFASLALQRAVEGLVHQPALLPLLLPSPMPAYTHTFCLLTRSHLSVEWEFWLTSQDACGPACDSMRSFLQASAAGGYVLTSCSGGGCGCTALCSGTEQQR